ncbi:unnamed protein product [Bursaphelenchus xylophilus]|uniref:(pine wood nematode) hypothetical protein n=1 Tax=Bursaphelenchus xylophilus TaxID=6326 RepID=A0A1I7SCY8_BURXY|nr:unnamed protein product [Bursaphelenchus xylophilus]CAG9093229.1 unnamed protein product [Bursaphelenchus xylophilus]
MHLGWSSMLLALVMVLMSIVAQGQSSIEEEEKFMEKRVPHPSFRSNVRIQHFQQGEMPPGFGHNFAPFMGRFGRVARNRPYLFDY